MNEKPPKKKQEVVIIVVLALVLVLIIMISKFIMGINFGAMENGEYLSIGYHEVHGSQMWALEFESFTGTISSVGSIPAEGSRHLMVFSKTGKSPLTLKVVCGNEQSEYVLDGQNLDTSIPGDQESFTLIISGTDVLTGYFNAVWE